MKKFLLTMLAVLVIFSTGITAQAFTTPSGTTSSGGSSSGGSGGGGGGGSQPSTGSTGSSTGSGLDITNKYPWSVYTPKVTYLKSVNAAWANYDGAPIYFMPQLKDFPTDLTTTVADLTDGTGTRHQFAAVYDGYFDNDVVYVAAQPSAATNARVMTSKKVYSSEDNSRLLNLVGYDLLLQQEVYNIEVKEGNIEMTYEPTRLTGRELYAETCIMDLYKAMGVYEWDIQFAYGVDKTLDVEKSPILQMLPVLTSGEKNKGYDTTESIVWVAATRTNPKQYWDRCMQDAIFDGGLHNVTARTSSYIGSETSVAFSLSRQDNVTLGEFCALARAIMTLYGEEVVPPAEEEACMLAYGLVVPKGSYSQEIYDSIVYLAAKGIVDPSEKNFNAHVTFADIEDILLRIADKSSRLTLKTTASTSMSRMGYTSVDRVALPSSENPISVINYSDLQYRDYLVELSERTKYYMVRSEAGLSITSNDKVINFKPAGNTSSSAANPWTGEKAQSTENIALKVVGDGNKITAMEQQEGYWQNCGIEEYEIDGVTRSFYHFKINPNVVSSIEFTDTKKDDENPGTEFSLPNSSGGVYLENSGSFEFKTFAEMGFDSTYRDEWSTTFTESQGIFLSSNKQLMTFSFDESVVDSVRQIADSDSAYQFSCLWDGNSGRLKTGTRIGVNESLDAYIFEPSSDDPNTYRIELYGTNISRVAGLPFITALLDTGAAVTSDVAFYRAEDNTLLISVAHLQRAGKISAFEDMGKGMYVMHVKGASGNGRVDTNVVIYDDDSRGFIMVGETLFPKQTDTLLEEYDGKYYVNAKALTGWASDIVLMPTGNSRATIAIDASVYNVPPNSSEDRIKTVNSYREIFTIGSSNKINVGVIGAISKRIGGVKSTFNGSGIALTSAYALSNYILVSLEDEATDHLFVYHIRGQGASSDLENDDAARSVFQDLTGFSFDRDENYFLVHYELDRAKGAEEAFNAGANATQMIVDEGQKHMWFVETEIRNSTFGTRKINWGWTYKPSKSDDLLDAMEKYAECSEDYMLPFVYVNSKGYDLNVNACKSSPTASSLEPVGHLPAYMYGERGQKLGKISSGNSAEADFFSVPDGNTFSDYKVIAAPTGLFSMFKGASESKISEVSNGLIFWGTTLVKYNSSNEEVTINGVSVAMPPDTKVTRSFLGTSLNSIWTIDESSMNVTKLNDSVNDVLKALFDRDADSLVDWDRYTFGRLIENLDSWSSIALIFILNILPRVCILLFFVLMLLSLIKDVKPFRFFCNNVFDIFKFLTFGHKSVETIDLKQTIFTSMICLALFYMIMDGALFNFILWVSEWFVVLMQK